MGYRIEEGETPAEGVRRVADGQLGKALVALDRAVAGPHDEDWDEAVHDARTRLKKARAALRLLRDGLGDAYGRENVALRDAGRLLAPAREAAVRVATVDALEERYGDQGVGRAFEGWRRVLAERHERARERAAAEGAAERARAAVAEVRARAPEWAVVGDEVEVVRRGLRRVVRRGRAGRGRALERGRPEDYHEWRKRTKYLWYHLRLLRDSWRRPLAAHAKEAHRLADLLGDEHDLADLAAALEGAPDGADPAETEALRGLIAARSAALRREAHRLGARLWAEAPSDLSGRLAAYLRAWLEPAAGPDPAGPAGRR